MAEKKYTGNINAGDIGDNNSRTLQQIIADATEEELAYYPDETMSKEEIKTMIRRRALKTKNRRIGIVTIAGLIMLAALGIFVAFDGFITDVDADKNPPQEIITQNGVVIEDGGWGSEEEDIWVITDWKEMNEVKQHVRQLLVPKKIPNRFNFNMLTINPLGGKSIICTYEFGSVNESNLIVEEYIHSNSLESLETEKVQKTVDSDKGSVYLRNMEKINIATIQMDDGIIIEIRGAIKESEILKIINSLE